MSDLKPCPHCNGPAHIVIGDEFCRIRCSQCGATGGPADAIRESDAIAAWNRRPTDTPAAAPLATSTVADSDGLIAAAPTMAEALKALLDQLDAVHADPRYRSVWEVSQLHVGPYNGPTYTAEYEAARAALAAMEGE